MPELPEAVKSQIDAAFASIFPHAGHAGCVSDCKATYEQCVFMGGKDCRGDLEACINGCPDGERPSAEQIQQLLTRLAAITP
jgi:hypothetical protein